MYIPYFYAKTDEASILYSFLSVYLYGDRLSRLIHTTIDSLKHK